MAKKRKNKKRHQGISQMTVERRIEEIEASWRGEEVERGAIIDSKTGKVLRSGHHVGRRRLLFLGGRKMMNNVVTHWHPGPECSFSYQDIRQAIIGGVKEARVSCQTCIFVMRMPYVSAETRDIGFRKRVLLAKSAKKQFREAGFPTHMTSPIKRALRNLRYGKETMQKWRLEQLKKLDSFWREFALRNPGFDYMRFPVKPTNDKQPETP